MLVRHFRRVTYRVVISQIGDNSLRFPYIPDRLGTRRCRALREIYMRLTAELCRGPCHALPVIPVCCGDKVQFSDLSVNLVGLQL